MTTIGASEVAVILGLQRGGRNRTSAFEVWARLMGLLPRYDGVTSPDGQLGHWLEPLILTRYAMEVGVAVVPGPPLTSAPLTHPSLPWHARPDGWTLDHTVEAKAPRTFGPEWGAPGSAAVPPAYAVQVVAQVAMAHALWGWEYGTLAAMARAPSWDDDRVWCVYRVNRDAERERRMVARVREWVDAHVTRNLPPLPDGTESARRVLGAVYRSHEVAHVATAMDLRRYHELLQVRAVVTELQERAALLTQHLQAAMGAATRLEHDQQVLATWREDRNGVRRWRITGGANAG